jgi:hypothetical protein
MKHPLLMAAGRAPTKVRRTDLPLIVRCGVTL